MPNALLKRKAMSGEIPANPLITRDNVLRVTPRCSAPSVIVNITCYLRARLNQIVPDVVVSSSPTHSLAFILHQ